MKTSRFYSSICNSVALITLILGGPACAAQGEITQPEDFLGHQVGADYKLARYGKIQDYFRQVAERSGRVNVRSIGLTTEGREMILAEITQDASAASLQKARADQKKIADPRLIRDKAEEQNLITNAKVVVYIHCNLHSTELAATQMAMELLYDLAVGDTPQIQDILNRTIIVLIPSANPDGMEKVIDWYEKSLGKPWEGTGMPWLYQKYAGHDNNRDWFMLNLQETRLETKVIYKEWLPHILYDIHQMGNSGARFFVPPFFDPKNPNIDPLNDHMMLILGGHIAAELTRAGKRGVINSAMYDNWWQGGFRSTAYRHNICGILTEAASVRIASPVFQRKSELRGARRGFPNYAIATNFPDPWPGGWWKLRDIVEYEKIACMSLLNLAARYHDLFISNSLKMAQTAIDRGKTEPPFAWLVPPEQRDPGTAADMLKKLHATGIEVHQARQDFTADGISYPQGTYILYCSQPYRNHLNDMMERQKYPRREAYPGGPLEAPYDIAGWTLPLMMGVKRVSVKQPFACQANKLDSIIRPAGQIIGPEEAVSYIVRAAANDDYRLINRLHKEGIDLDVIVNEIHWKNITGMEVPRGSVMISDGSKLHRNRAKLHNGISSDLIGLAQFYPQAKSALRRAKPPRIAVYQPWTAIKDEGWIRLVLDNFEFDYTLVHNAEIRTGDLHKRYDCLILPSISTSSILNGRSPDTTAPQYVGGIGPEGIIQLQEFVRSGGILLCNDGSCNLPIENFNIPVRNIVRGKPSQEFFCPGSILRIELEPDHPVTYGMPRWISGYFARSQAFELIQPKKPKEGEPKDLRDPAKRFPARVLARYSDTVLLESGWIQGGKTIADKPAIVEVQYGQGKILLFGFRVQHRGQTPGTFRLLFNAILYSALG